MSASDEFFEKVVQGIKELAQSLFTETVAAAKNDGEAFIAQSKEKLERWVGLLSNGDITRDDFEFLVKMQGDLAEMHALKAAGLARQRIERFRQSVISLLISTAFSLIPI